MSTLKGLLFNQYAAEGLTSLVEEMQSKYTAKKGRRFNYNNVTYEVSRPTLSEGTIEYEISSKIPENEIKTPKEMQAFFQQVKKFVCMGDFNRDGMEMEIIVCSQVPYLLIMPFVYGVFVKRSNEYKDRIDYV